MPIKPPSMILIPKEHFMMGSIPNLDPEAYEEESPLHIVYLTDYALSRAPVTNAEYAEFIAAAQYPGPDGWHDKRPPHGKEAHPVVNVSWQDAAAYCEWLSAMTERMFRLPSEAEWEKGARGVNARMFPWGYTWESNRCNTLEAGLKGTVPIEQFQNGASPYGLLDMAGNVFEWTNTLWKAEHPSSFPFRYPYDPDDGRESPNENERVSRIVRGGSFLRPQRYARCASRASYTSNTRMPDLGFRIAEDVAY